MRPAHWYEPGIVYHITINTHSRYPWFREESNALLTVEDMEFYRRKFDLKVLLYVIMPDVIMPDHFHWAILPSVENFKLFREDQVRHRKKYHQYPERYYLSKIMEDFERHIAFVINERVGIRGRPVWQEGFVAKRVENRPAFGALADYIHHNPVKAGLVEKPEDYKFSSFRSLYLDDHSVFRVDANEF